jgi:hypothetical protein
MPGVPSKEKSLIIKQLRLSFVWLFLVSGTLPAATDADVEARVSALLEKMTVAEKIGQMSQLNGAEGEIPDGLRETIRRGRVGSILNEVSVGVVNEMQRIAVEESRLGIPLLIGRGASRCPDGGAGSRRRGGQLDLLADDRHFA